MPCFNGSRYLRDSIASVTHQSYTNWELVVVDDGSTDDSLDILRHLAASDGRIKIESQRNSGAATARNTGLALARGAYVAFLDADDLWHATFLQKLVQEVEAAGVDLAYCGWQNLGLSGGPGQPYIPPDYASGDKYESFLKVCPWPIHAALTRRQALASIGGFNPRWRTCEDYDLWLRLGTRSSVALVPEVLAFYRHHEGEQTTKNRARIAIDHWLIQRDFLATRPEIKGQLTATKIRQLTHGELLHRGYISYWQRDLPAARRLFRLVMANGYGTPKDWIYMLPSLLPLSAHRALIRLREHTQ